ncbi:relaxase/mobilization nuclease domain-containing protein [Plectonema radiosum]|uniref:relaxase/mobilization nuclease domain-containing protein n=1 Tax=Plectonema radiosum TaxID=945768 RepID=UPI0035C8C8D9
MGFEKNLYFAASHSDRNHFHPEMLPQVASTFLGECVSDWYDKRRLEKVLRNLESQFGLTSAILISYLFFSSINPFQIFWLHRC